MTLHTKLYFSAIIAPGRLSFMYAYYNFSPKYETSIIGRTKK